MPADPTVVVDGRTLTLTNLDKVLYPATGTTKAEVVSYYARIAPVLVPHLAGRAITMRRFPDGVEGPSFFQKNCPGHRPAWIPVADAPGGVRSCVLDEPAALVWAANLAALELHAPMARAADLDTPTGVVLDLDPGPPAGLPACCAVALDVAEILEAVGLRAWAKTSGAKGLQLVVPVNGPVTHEQAASFALAIGRVLERRTPQRVVTTMTRSAREGRVLLDWSQNNRAKTTIAVYSLRAQPRPTVSTPITWDEVAACARGGPEPRFGPEEVLGRVASLGDLFAPVLEVRQVLPDGQTRS